MPKVEGQIGGELEDLIRKELEDCNERLRAPSLDDRPFVANMIHQRAETLRWVLREALLLEVSQ